MYADLPVMPLLEVIKAAAWQGSSGSAFGLHLKVTDKVHVVVMIMSCDVHLGWCELSSTPSLPE